MAVVSGDTTATEACALEENGKWSYLKGVRGIAVGEFLFSKSTVAGDAEKTLEMFRITSTPAEIYAAASGDDASGEGTDASPYKSISKALSGESAAATIVMKD